MRPGPGDAAAVCTLPLQQHLEPAVDQRLAVGGHRHRVGCILGSAISCFHVPSRTAREGKVSTKTPRLHPARTSPPSQTMVSLPSGISSPQHSTTVSAPCSLNRAAAFSAWRRQAVRLALGTGMTDPSTQLVYWDPGAEPDRPRRGSAVIRSHADSCNISAGQYRLRGPRDRDATAHIAVSPTASAAPTKSCWMMPM